MRRRPYAGSLTPRQGGARILARFLRGAGVYSALESRVGELGAEIERLLASEAIVGVRSILVGVLGLGAKVPMLLYD